LEHWETSVLKVNDEKPMTPQQDEQHFGIPSFKCESMNQWDGVLSFEKQSAGFPGQEWTFHNISF
jgi:hypothetical protein